MSTDTNYAIKGGTRFYETDLDMEPIDDYGT